MVDFFKTLRILTYYQRENFHNYMEIKNQTKEGDQSINTDLASFVLYSIL